MTDLPRVAFIATGGTIDSVGSSRLDLAWYSETGMHLAPGQLVAEVPETESFATIEQCTFPGRPCHEFTDEDWIMLAKMVAGLACREDIQGVVISHGTNTLEETAYFLHLTVASPKPIVLVGAMRPSSALGTDGYLNVVRAFQVAASPIAADLGVLVVMNDTIFAARDVTKRATYRVDAFGAGDLGPLGFADADGTVRIYHMTTSLPRPTAVLDISHLRRLPRVDIVLSYVGADETLVNAAIEAGARGIVCAGAGAGQPTPPERRALERAADRGVVICLSSRTGQGRVSLRPSRRMHMVTADNLRPWKARIVVSLALANHRDLPAIQELLDTV